MTQEELNYIKDSFSQIIDDIAGNPDWHDAAGAVASNLGTLERQLKEKVVELPSEIDEAADTFAHNGDVNGGVGGDDYEDDLRITFKVGAEWMAQQGETIFDTINMDGQGQRWLSDNLLQGDYDCGEEVIIQIRKKQQL